MLQVEAGHGLFASLRKLLATGVDTLKTRLELLSIEIEQEKLRLFSALVYFGFSLLLLGIGLLFLGALLVLLFWDSYRIVALASMTLVFILGGLWLLQSALIRLRAPGGLFASSLSELTKDSQELGKPI